MKTNCVPRDEGSPGSQGLPWSFPALLLLCALLAGTDSLAESGNGIAARHVIDGVTFEVASPNVGSVNTVTVRGTTAAGAVDTVDVEADGTVSGIDVGDLNGDGRPEVYVYVTSAGSGSYGSLIAFTWDRDNRLSRIRLPAISSDEALAMGYMGHDEFAVEQSALTRRFPIYREGDPNARPSGGFRLIRYRLESEESGWVLRQDEILDMPDRGSGGLPDGGSARNDNFSRGALKS